MLDERKNGRERPSLLETAVKYQRPVAKWVVWIKYL